MIAPAGHSVAKRRRAGLLAVALLAHACGDEAKIASLPVANAGFDWNVPRGTLVRLDGTGSYDPTGARLTLYRWDVAALPVGSTAEADPANDGTATFTPDQVGSYLVSLVVSNGKRESMPDFVTISATGTAGPNQPPVARIECLPPAGGCTIKHARSVKDAGGSEPDLQLSGRSSSDPELQPLSYAWSQIVAAVDCAALCPEISSCDPLATPVSSWITAQTEVAVKFVAPREKGALVFRLVVSDGELSDDACVSVSVTNNAPQALIGSASPPTSASQGSLIRLVATPGDPDTIDNPFLTYTWAHEVPSGIPSVTFTPVTGTPEAIDAQVTGYTGTITFKLSVSDGIDASATCVPGLSSCGVGTCCWQMTIN